MNTEKNMSKIPMTEDTLLKNFKGLVYPYVGSSMLVNHKDEGVIIKNANICLDLAKQFTSQQNKELIAENQTYISLLDDATKEFNRQEKEIEELKEQLRTESDCVEHMKDVEVNYKKEIEELKAEIERLKNKVSEYTNMLEDVVNELDLSEAAIEKHGPLGTPPAELVKLVLEQKDKQITMLNHGMKQIKP